jgi:hypothetical protein
MVVGLALSVADAAEGGRRNSRKATEVRIVPPAPELIGTVTYDTGVNAGFHPDATVGNLNRCVGNRFNTALGGPLLATGMVSMLTVFPANNGTQSISIATAPNAGGTAMVLDFLAANMMANQFNAVTIAPAVAVTSDFVGFFLGLFGATQPAGLIGMSDMQNLGQGYHAVEGFYFGSALATMVTPVANRNAMLRVTGDILVPVELMDFKIQ